MVPREGWIFWVVASIDDCLGEDGSTVVLSVLGAPIPNI